MRAPYTDPLFRDFRVWIDAVHALAEKSPGFVWRYEGEKTDAGYIQADPAEPLLMGNLSVWERADDLHRFTFSGAHAEMMKGRKKWFEKMDQPYSVFWTQLASAPFPEVKQGLSRLYCLRALGDTEKAFGTNFLKREGIEVKR